MRDEGVRDAVVVSLAGEITWEKAHRLREQLEAVVTRGARNVVADLSEVAYVDSSGLATLLAANRRLRKLGGRLALVNVPDHIMRALRQARVCEFLPATGQRPSSHDKIMTAPVEAPVMVRTLSVPCDASRMGETRQKVSELFGGLGLARDTVFDLTLAFGEALGNAFDHGGGSRADGFVTVSVSVFRDRVVVEVTDDGCGCAFGDGGTLPTPTETRGRGIRLMTMLADGMSITPRHDGTGTSVRLVKMFDAPKAKA